MIEIEALPFVGRKTIWSGDLKFPRTLLNAPIYTRRSPIFLLYNHDDAEVPREIKAAEIENALGIIQKSYRPTTKAAVLFALGLVPAFSDDNGRLSSKRAEQLLKPFLGTLKA